jgi:hypothetical protein
MVQVFLCGVDIGPLQNASVSINHLVPDLKLPFQLLDVDVFLLQHC